MEMSERLSWQETEHDTSEFTADLAPLIFDADTTAGVTSGDNNGIESDFAEPAHCEQQLGAAEETEVALGKIECPGCRAIYEVGGKVIPPDGRDMQCSNCGHEWFHPSDTSAGIDPPQTSPSAPEQPGVHDLASQGESKPSVDGASAPKERIRPVEARLQAFSGCQFQGMSSSMRLIL